MDTDNTVPYPGTVFVPVFLLGFNVHGTWYEYCSRSARVRCVTKMPCTVPGTRYPVVGVGTRSSILDFKLSDSNI